jgi:mono/diheme cytochrome c family protein
MQIESTHDTRIHPARTVVLIVIAIAMAGIVLAIVVTGCSSTPDFPTHLSFPTRKDRLVLKVPETPPQAPSPGKLESELAELDSRGGKTVDPTTLSSDVQAAIDRFLKDSFGTPAAPAIQPGNAETSSAVERLGLSNDRLTEGSKLFRKHCLACHGLPGDGRGQAGLFLNPYPRDFRRGAFKFATSGEGLKPRRKDLLRTIREGLPPMPSFSLLQEQERELLAVYATYLAIRGQVEFQTLAEQIASSNLEMVEPHGRQLLKEVLNEWEKAERAPALPAAPDDGEPMSEPHKTAVRRGYELFIAKTDTECLKCHGDFGRKPLPKYDIWGTIATPANFTANLATTPRRGGSSPEDIYARIRFGISPIGMPAHPKLTDRQVWDLVRFVRSAPYPRELPEDIRNVVHP